MKEPKVSIITPCYNGAHGISRMLDSVLAQTYSNIEFILVNDGSTDNSEQIWKSYEPLFKERGYETKYLFQENQGLGAAINSGLKQFTGDYLCWPDVDDILEPTSVEKRVSFLEEHQGFGSVSSNANIYNEYDLHHAIGTACDHLLHIAEEWQFRYMVSGHSLYCCGCHMLRSKYFLEVNPNREIYPARRGQNNQMLLPIYYKYKHGYIDEPLYDYIIYDKSMSTPDESLERAVNRAEEYMQILHHTLAEIPMDEETKIFCDKQLQRIEWDMFSSAYIKFGKPMSFIKKYLSLKMYKTNQKREINGVRQAVRNKK